MPARGAFRFAERQAEIGGVTYTRWITLKQYLVDAFHCKTGIDEPTSIGGRKTLELGGSVRRSGFSSADNYADDML